jgi:hypothetical protein
MHIEQHKFCDTSVSISSASYVISVASLAQCEVFEALHRCVTQYSRVMQFAVWQHFHTDQIVTWHSHRLFSGLLFVQVNCGSTSWTRLPTSSYMLFIWPRSALKNLSVGASIERLEFAGTVYGTHRPQGVTTQNIRRCIQKFPDWVDNEINNDKNKHTLRSNIKGYGNKTH